MTPDVSIFKKLDLGITHATEKLHDEPENYMKREFSGGLKTKIFGALA